MDNGKGCADWGSRGVDTEESHDVAYYKADEYWILPGSRFPLALGGCGPLMMPEINCSVSITRDHFPIKFIWHFLRGGRWQTELFSLQYDCSHKIEPKITHKCHRKFGIYPIRLRCRGKLRPWQLEFWIFWSEGIWPWIITIAKHMAG